MWKSHLSTKLEVHHDNADLGARYHQDYKHQEEKAEKVIELVLPDCLKQRHSRNLFPCYCDQLANMRLILAANPRKNEEPHSLV